MMKNLQGCHLTYTRRNMLFGPPSITKAMRVCKQKDAVPFIVC